MESVPPEAEPKPMSFLAAAGWSLVAVLLYAFALSIAEALREGAIADLVTHTTCRVLACSLVLFIILRVHEPQASIRHVLALRPPPILALPLAIVVGAGLAGPLAWLDKILLARFPYTDKEQEALERLFGDASFDTPSKKLVLVLTMVVAMPIVDELFFRGAIFTPLRKGRRLEPVVMATAAFETLSTSPHAREMLSLLALALALSWIRGLSGSVLPSIVARIAFFAPEFVPTAIGRELPPLSKGMLAGSLGAALLALAALAIVSRRDARAVEARAFDA